MKIEPYFYWRGEDSYIHMSITGPRAYFMNNWYRGDPEFLFQADMHSIPDLALLLVGALPDA